MMPQELLMEGMTFAKTYRCNLQVLHTDQPRLIMAKLHHSRAQKESGNWQLYYLTLFRAAPSAVSKGRGGAHWAPPRFGGDVGGCGFKF